MQITDDRIAESSTSTGASDFTLSGALPGHVAYSSKAVNGSRVPYLIQSVDASGSPTGEWEDGLGIWLTGNILQRTFVSRSSNVDTLVNFSAGTKHVFLPLMSCQMYQDNGVPFRALESLSPGFDIAYKWDFDVDAEGWTATNGTVGWSADSGGSIILSDTHATLSTFLYSPAGLAINGVKYPRVKMSLTRIAGSGFIGTGQYVTAGRPAFSSGFQRKVTPPMPFEIGETIIVDWDMMKSTDVADWTGSNATQFRFVLPVTATTDDVFRIDWIAIGRNAPVSVPVIVPDGVSLIRAASFNVLSSLTAQQPLFATPNALSVIEGSYSFDGILAFSGMSGTTGNGQFDFKGAGSATLSEITMSVMGIDGTGIAANQTGTWSTTGVSAANMVTSTTSSTIYVRVRGVFNVTIAGTVVPSITLTNGSVGNQLNAGSYIQFKRLGDLSLANIGAWS